MEDVNSVHCGNFEIKYGGYSKYSKSMKMPNKIISSVSFFLYFNVFDNEVIHKKNLRW